MILGGKFGQIRLFIFIMGSAGKFISSQTEDRIFIFNRNNFFKKQKMVPFYAKMMGTCTRIL